MTENKYQTVFQKQQPTVFRIGNKLWDPLYAPYLAINLIMPWSQFKGCYDQLSLQEIAL